MRTEVVVIGGGATGAGVLRDLALRGIEAILLEKDELTSGTSGRNHGLLHSGARYAVNDPDSARQCIAENRILKKIAFPCIEETGGFFLSLPQDPPSYPDELLRACENLGLAAAEISVAKNGDRGLRSPHTSPFSPRHPPGQLVKNAPKREGGTPGDGPPGIKAHRRASKACRVFTRRFKEKLDIQGFGLCLGHRKVRWWWARL